MDLITTKYIKTPAGELILGSYRNRLCLCDWRYRRMRDSIDNRIRTALDSGYEEGDSEVISEAQRQLDQYFSGDRKDFEISLLPVGTDFQKRVWEELMKIPYGSTSTYGELSRRLGNGGAVRAVAAANGANAISIIIPCHRVIGAGGKLVGYAGGLIAKERLLGLESSGRLQLQMSFKEEHV